MRIRKITAHIVTIPSCDDLRYFTRATKYLRLEDGTWLADEYGDEYIKTKNAGWLEAEFQQCNVPLTVQLELFPCEL